MTTKTRPRVSPIRWRLRPVVFLAGSKPIRRPRFAAFERLGVQDGRGGFRLASGADAHPATELVVDLVPGAVAAPGGQPAVRGIEGHQIVREHAPRATRAQHVEDRIRDHPVVVDAGPCAFAQVTYGHEGFDHFPHAVGAAGGMASAGVIPVVFACTHTT
jgi:hypothetical protein